MGFFNNFPYTNFHELNVDWLLKTYRTSLDNSIKAIGDSEKAVAISSESEKRVNSLADETQDKIDEIISSLPEIVKPEIEAVILKMVQNGTIEGVMNLDFVSVKTFGAIGDDITDDSDAIISAFNSGYNIYFPSGVYKVSKVLPIHSNTVVVGNNATIKQYTTNIDTVTAQRESNIQIIKMNFHQNEKANTVGSFERAIRVTNCKNILVRDCYFYNFVSGFVCDYVEATFNENILIENCRFEKYNFAILPAQYRFMVISNCSGTGVENTHINPDGTKLDPPHLIYSTDRASPLVPEALFIVNCAEFGNPYDCAFKVRNIKGLSMVNCQAIDCNRGIEIASATDVVIQGLVANLTGNSDGSAAAIYAYDVNNATFANINVKCVDDARKYCIRLTTNLTNMNNDVVFSNINFDANNTNTRNLIPITLFNSNNVTIDGFVYRERGGYFRRIIRTENVNIKIMNFVVNADIFEGHRIVLAEANSANDVIKAVVAPAFFPINTIEITNNVEANTTLVLLTS